jgi:hypothetical protein
MIKILLTSFLILLSYYAVAQSKEVSLEKLNLIYQGDPPSLSENYEILLNNKKIIYKPPIINYEDVKGLKPSYSKKIKKQEWKNLITIINKLDFAQLDSLNKEKIEGERYFLDVTFSNQGTKKYFIQNNKAPDYLNELLETIRKIFY